MAHAGNRATPSTSPSRACTVCSSTAASSRTTPTRCAEAVQRAEVEYEIGLPGEGVETERFFSDLGHEYVTINAEYTT